MRRIVVTGMGAISPLGANVKACWSRLLSGRSGLRRLPDDMVEDLSTKVGGCSDAGPTISPPEDLFIGRRGKERQV